MTTSRTIIFALALTAAASAALSQGPLTREQVKADRAEAQRNGEIIGNGETGAKLNELNPGRYPATRAVPGKTRAQVRAELSEAQRTGDIVGNSRTGQKLNEIYPDRYPPKPIVPGKTRSEVKAELAQAVRNGDVIANGETGAKLNELSPALNPTQARGRKAPAQAATAQREMQPVR